jgi:hypothetical protein
MNKQIIADMFLCTIIETDNQAKGGKPQLGHLSSEDSQNAWFFVDLFHYVAIVSKCQYHIFIYLTCLRHCRFL